MPNFCLKFSIFIILAALVLALFSPLAVKAQTTQNEEQAFLQAKIQLLKLQVELLKTQISLFLKSFQRQVANCAQLNITWERVQGATGYRLYRDSILVYEGSNRSFTDSKLTLQKQYRYVVYGLRQGKQGEPSEVKEITAPDICPPSTPKISFRAEPCGGNITLNWNSSPTASLYQVFRANREIYSGPPISFIDSKITPNSSHEYKIRAGNRGGWSDFLVPVSFKASNVCAPSAPEISVVIPITEKEGRLLAEMRTSPRNNTKIRPDIDRPSVMTSVMALSVKAHFSDITVTRIDLFFDSQPWRFLDRVEIRYGGRTVAAKETTQEAFTKIGSEHIYQLRLDGFSALAKEDRTGTFTVRVDAKEPAPGPLPHDITVFLENNSVRGIDKARIFHLVPVSGGGKGNIFSRTFQIE